MNFRIFWTGNIYCPRRSLALAELALVLPVSPEKCFENRTRGTVISIIGALMDDYVRIFTARHKMFIRH